MEILGLDPYQSQTQYLHANLRFVEKWRQGGTKLPVWCRFFRSVLLKRQQSGTMLPLRKALSSIMQSACRKIGCND